MRIQEMKSGMSHLKKRVGTESRVNFFESLTVQEVAIELEKILPTKPDCELNEPRWSIVSFDKLEADKLTYKQASDLMSVLDAHGISGLCIVTNEAASHIHCR